MKVVIIGLGNFGMSLAINLSNTGNEVIVADHNLEKIELMKEKVAHAVAIDATNENAYHSLPLNNADLAIIAIGERNGVATNTWFPKLGRGKFWSDNQSNKQTSEKFII